MAGGPGGDGGIGVYAGMPQIFGGSALGLQSLGLGFPTGGMPPQGW